MTLLELVPTLGMVAATLAGVGAVLWVEWGFWAEFGVLLAAPVVGWVGTVAVMSAVFAVMILVERWTASRDDSEE